MKVFARILHAFVTFVTGASIGAASVFSYAGIVHGNTDPVMTSIVWSTVGIYIAICMTTSFVWR